MCIKLWQWCGERVDLSGFNAFENHPTRYVLKATRAKVRVHGIFRRSELIGCSHGHCPLPEAIETLSKRGKALAEALDKYLAFVRVGSLADIRHLLKHRLLSARKQTLGAERRQSARKRTFRRRSANVRFVPKGDIQRRKVA